MIVGVGSLGAMHDTPSEEFVGVGVVHRYCERVECVGIVGGLCVWVL